MKKINILVVAIFLTSCGSSEIVRSKDKCTIKKHAEDDLYQVRINEKPVNNRWYLEQDANEIKLILAVRNKCMR